MILHFNCPPISGNPAARPLVFTWDPGAGTVAGPDADQVRELAKPGARLDAHPRPWSVTLGPDPLRSWRDVAVIVGTSWRMPRELRPHYPQLPRGSWDGKVRDSEGNVVGHMVN